MDSINQSSNGANQYFVYDDGRIVTAYLPGDIVQYNTYDNSGRKTSVKAVRNGVTLTHYTGTYAKATGTDTELLQTETDNVSGISTAYSYDGLNRLVGAAGTGSGASSFAYTYDANGNRTSYSKNGATAINYGYNAANQLVTQDGWESGTFDNAGNQTSTGTGLWIDYNAKNQAMTFGPPNTTPISATYTDVGNVERTQLGSKAQLHGQLGLYSDTQGTSTTYYTRMATGSGQVVSQTINGTSYYYLTDLRGSTAKMTDQSGTVHNTYSYDPYGNTLSSSGTVSNAIRYTGGYYDTETGLYKLGARYYNASDARWTQLDPSGQDPQYIYAGNNPVNYVDPSGYAPELTYYQELTLNVWTGCGLGVASALLPAAAAAVTGVGAPVSAGAIVGGCALGVAGGIVSSQKGSEAGLVFELIDLYNKFR